eukprot:XP_001689596.1 predicted protein [Chlamydomonas reinhardtii]
MFDRRVEQVRQQDAAAKVAVIAEGGGDAAALLGLVRLSHWLLGAASTCGVGSSSSGGGAPGEQDARQLLPEGLGSSRRLVTDVGALPHPQSTPYRILVDSGTGTTAIGLAIGIALLGLPWTVVGIMLAGEESYYRSQAQQLLSSFLQRYGPELYGIGRAEATGLGGARGGSSTVGASATAAAAEAGGAGEASAGALPLQWVPRLVPRRFGKVFPQDIATCKQVAQSHGIGLDPIYSLSAWELACWEAQQAAVAAAAAAPAAGAVDAGMGGVTATPVVMLHGGGALGLHGLAQRYPGAF